MVIERAIGRWPVQIVYRDSKGRTTKTVVTVYSVRNGKARVLDWRRRALRTLATRRILAAIPVVRRVS
ncbi:hypothetical protein [Cohnella thermotolerans]|uniref:hypothetical protein n=1 Tax=Cohnella thermotolerans TaxID=329858 RepID=UPI0003F59D13|nr:hypothetical protein [Cohnella thermotolerans]